MARKRNLITPVVSFNMQDMATRTQGMSDTELGVWFRKAIADCCSGCANPKVDPFVKEQFDKSQNNMRKKQDHDAQTYQNRLARQGKTLAESATRTSEAVKALADAPTREDGVNPEGQHMAPKAESGPSAKTLSEARQAQARESLPAGERGKRSRAISRPVDAPAGSPADVEATPAKRPYGTCGHVMLTDAEGRTLRETYGKHLAIAIDILDAYIENNGKAAKKYKNHAAVLRKGNWVWNKVQEMILNEKRIENASKGPKNWKAQERERTARVLRGESADGSNIVRDEDLTPEELERKYA